MADVRAGSLAPATRVDVQLVEQADTSRIPDARPDADDCDSECQAARKDGEHRLTSEQRGETLAQRNGAGRGRFELGVEVVEEPPDLRRLIGVGQTRSVVVIHVAEVTASRTPI